MGGFFLILGSAFVSRILGTPPSPLGVFDIVTVRRVISGGSTTISLQAHHTCGRSRAATWRSSLLHGQADIRLLRGLGGPEPERSLENTDFLEGTTLRGRCR